MRPNTIEKIVARLVPNENGCLIWPGAKSYSGHGHVHFQGKMWIVHRLLYVHFVGPIPEGHHLHHLCETPACANHEHLSPLTYIEHAYQHDSLAVRHSSKTTCPQGHPYEGDNLIILDRGTTKNRICRICNNERNRRSYRNNRRDLQCVKMTQELADEIRRLRATGLLQKEIAEATGVSISQIIRVLQNRIWPHPERGS